jgi:ABC-2 type transport system permease protein
MKVGTLPWILRHELRLWWREITVRPIAIFFLGIFVILPLIWVCFTLANLRDARSFHTIPDTAIWIAVVVWLFGFYYGFIQAMRSSLMGLFERKDLDLLVSSPISSKVIFASRVLAIALKTFFSGCLFVIPLSLIAVLFGVPQLLGLYPALIGISLSATSLAMLFVLVLVRVVGAKRARIFSQVLTALFPITVYLSSQLPILLIGNSNTESIWFRLEHFLASGSFLSANSWVWFPARAIFFDPLSVLLVLIISSALTWVTVEILHSSFIAGTQQELTSKHRQLRPTEATRFVGGFYRIALFKEWRIMRRNPYLFSRIFLQIFFLTFPFIGVLRQQNGNSVNFFSFTWPISLVFGEVLASTLTQICVSGEEAPDLLKSSPVDSRKLRQLKLLAALIPIWLFMSPLFIVLMVNGKSWFMPIVVFLAGTTCAATLSMWNSRPVKLTELFGRRQNSQVDVLLKLLEIISLLSWGWLGFSLQQGHLHTVLISLAVIGIVVGLAYGRSRQLGFVKPIRNTTTAKQATQLTPHA